MANGGAIRYEFRFDTPTQVTDPNTQQVSTVNVPTVFALSGPGFTDDVAKGMRKGLRLVPSITNVAAAKITETSTTVAETP